MNSGKFITVEGSEGGGKTTNLAHIYQRLTEHNLSVVQTREPGGTPLGEKIRELLLTPTENKIAEDTELLLMFAARAQHLNEKIRPALAEGKWVLCDRFTDASFAYQGNGRGISTESIAQLEMWTQQGLQPDLTILLDIDPEIGLERAGKRGELDRFEQEEIEFFQRIREGYLQRAKQFPQRFRVIDASKSLEEVKQQIDQVLEAFIVN